MSVDLGAGVVVARLRGHVVELVPIGIAGDLAMPLAVGRDLDGAWLVGESAATLAGQGRGDILTQLVWAEENQSVAGLSVPTADLVARVVSQALLRALDTPTDELTSIVIATPTSCSTSTALALHANMAAAYPGVRVELCPGVVAAVESFANESQVPVGTTVLVVDWREGLPDIALISTLPAGFELSSPPFAATALPTGRDAVASPGALSPANLRHALEDVLRVSGQATKIVLLVGRAAAIPSVRQSVVDLLPTAQLISLGEPAIALGAARKVAKDLDWAALSDAPVETDVEQSTVLDDDVQFTVYRPRSVRSDRWVRLLAFAHKTDEVQDDERSFDPVEEVRREAAAVLGDDSQRYVAVARDSVIEVPRGGTISFVPDVPGVEFDPPTRQFRWLRPVHREEFLFRAAAHLEGSVAHGTLSVYLDTLLIADVSLAIKVDSHAADPRPERSNTQRYRKVFPSYSHFDEAIVESVGRVVTAFGDEFVRDVDHLRSGEVWSTRLESYIRDADVFQLYWSHNSMVSRFVQAEWLYALQLQRPGFIRPVFWEQPRPTSPEPRLPPPELDRIHFSYLPLGETSRQERPAEAVLPPELIAAPPARQPQQQQQQQQPLGPPYYQAPQGYSAPQPQSPAPARRRRMIGIASVAAGAAALAVVFATVVLPGNSGHRGAIGIFPTESSSPVPFPSSSTDFSTSAPPSPSETQSGPVPVSVSDARLIVGRYLDDINAQDRADAETLICPEDVTSWRNAIDKPGGDFTVTITHVTFESSTPRSDGIDLTYSLDVTSRTTGQTGVSPVTFTIVDRSGELLICGER